MVRLILHIGMHKCGSTFIQNTLYENGALLREHRVLYPRTGLFLGQVGAGRRHTKITAASKLGDPDAPLFRELHREIEASAAQTVVISHEGISEPGVPAHVFRDIFKAYDTTVVVYGRSPADYLESRYRSSIRTNAFAGEIDAYIANMTDRLKVRDMLARWREDFGAANVRFFSFDTLPRDTPLANHVLEAAGVSIPALVPTAKANVRDTNARLLVRLMGNGLAPAYGISSTRIRFDVDFDYGSNEGRLISDAALAELEPAIAAHRELLVDEGQPPVADRLAAQPYDPGFFDPEIRARAREAAEAVLRRAVERRKSTKARSVSAAKRIVNTAIAVTKNSARELVARLERLGRKASWSATGVPPVVILMRYSVLQEAIGKSRWHISRNADNDEYRQKLFSDERMGLHFRTLSEIVLPSLKAQTLKLDAARHRLIVFTSTELPAHHLAALKGALAPLKWATIEMVPPTEEIEFTGPTKRVLDELGIAEGPYATVRLDDDDALARIFLEKLSALIVPANAGKVVTFPRGYVGLLDGASCRFTEFRAERHPFNAQGLAAIGLVEHGKLTPVGHETVHKYADHTRIQRRHPYLLDASFPAFIRTIHPQQDTQGVDRDDKLSRLKVAPAETVRREFGIG